LSHNVEPSNDMERWRKHMKLAVAKHFART